MASRAQNNNVGGASVSNPALSWQTWKAREGNAEGINIDLVKTGAAIEIPEFVKVGKKKHTIDQHVQEAKTKETENGKEKGKEEGERRGKEKGGEDVEMGRSKFITPALTPLI